MKSTKVVKLIISCLLSFCLGMVLLNYGCQLVKGYDYLKKDAFLEQKMGKGFKMSDLSLQVPISSKREFNVGLTSPSSSLLLELMGKPGPLTENCSPILSLRILKMLLIRDVGPFRTTGIRPAVETLDRVFSRVLQEKPEVYREVKSLGMLCCRKVRGKEVYSNHSWGIAIDLMFGNEPDVVGDGMTQRGLLELVDYFNAEGFYWGGGFEGKREDSMHFEASTELLNQWNQQGFLN